MMQVVGTLGFHHVIIIGIMQNCDTMSYSPHPPPPPPPPPACMRNITRTKIDPNKFLY